MRLSQQEYETKVIDEVLRELRDNDPVIRNFSYVSFVSKSKGIRNGKRRFRRNWKEVELVSYQGGHYSLWHRFPFDIYASEVLGDIEDVEKKLMNAVKRVNK